VGSDGRVRPFCLNKVNGNPGDGDAAYLRKVDRLPCGPEAPNYGRPKADPVTASFCHCEPTNDGAVVSFELCRDTSLRARSTQPTDRRDY